MKKYLLSLVCVIACASVVVTVSGCASAQGRVVMTEDAVHDAIAKVDDSLRTFCTAPANAEQYKVPCQDARKLLLPVIDSGIAFNRAVADQKFSGFSNVVTTISALVEALKKLPSSATASMITELARAIQAAAQQVTSAGGK